MGIILALDPGITSLTTENGIVTIIDENVYDWASKRIWKATLKDGNWYIKNDQGYYLHDYILEKPPGYEIDHINRNTLDNRRENLRIATSSQNKMNRPKQRNNRSSQFKGVSYDKARGKWIAQLMADGQRKLSKRFDTEIEAALAYNAASKEFHGEFGYVNPIP